MFKPILLPVAIAAALASSSVLAAPAKNVIFFLGDGMGTTTVTAAQIYKVGEEGLLTMETLDHTARIKTFSHDAQTTDSAPSMSAYMTGVKMNNEVLSMSSDTIAEAPLKDANGNKGLTGCASSNGQAVPTLLELAKAQGKAVGAVTTTELTHATPAATYSHICHRDAAYDIAVQAIPNGKGFNTALGDGVDVLMGGGANYWTPYDATNNKRGRADGRDLTAELRSQGYASVTTKAELAAVDPAANSRLIGLFTKDYHLDYDLDRQKNAASTQPSLAEMTSKAIDILKTKPEGYFLMVEGGRIDHALHGTNAKRALQDTVAFDNAIKTALSKVDLSNTLIVVTADHDHTMTFNGYSAKGNPILDLVKEGANKTIKRDVNGNAITTLAFGNGPNRKDTRTDLTSDQVMADDYLQETGVKLGSETHGGGDVMLFASGANAELFKGTLDNTAVFTKVKSALGL